MTPRHWSVTCEREEARATIDIDLALLLLALIPSCGDPGILARAVSSIADHSVTCARMDSSSQGPPANVSASMLACVYVCRHAPQTLPSHFNLHAVRVFDRVWQTGISSLPTVLNPSLTLTMPLAAQPNTRVGVVNATAEAGAEPLSYKLMQGPSTFSVTEHTGEIFLKQQLTVASSIQLTIAGAFLCVCVFVSLCVSLCVCLFARVMMEAHLCLVFPLFRLQCKIRVLSALPSSQATPRSPWCQAVA